MVQGRIVSFWTYSFSLLKWCEFKTLLLGTGAAIKRAFPLVLRHAGLGAAGLSATVFLSQGLEAWEGSAFLLPIRLFLALLAILLLLHSGLVVPLLALRASYHRKDQSYFWGYRLPFALLAIVAYAPVASFFGVLTFPLPALISIFVRQTLGSASLLFMFFLFFDLVSSRPVPVALAVGAFRTLKMVLCFWPILLTSPLPLFGVLFAALTDVHAQMFADLASGWLLRTPWYLQAPLIGVLTILLAFSSVIWFAFYSTVYLRLKHDQGVILFGASHGGSR